MFANNVYDKLKFLVQFILPALGVFYYSLAEIWGFPHPTEIVATISAVSAFIGALLGISTIKYNLELKKVEANFAETVLKTGFFFPEEDADRIYEILKWSVLIFIPSLSALYGGLAIIWGLPYADQFVGTCSALTTFLGIALGFSTAKYKEAISNS